MLPKSSRIPRKDFSLLLKNSPFFHSPHFILRVGEGNGVRVGVSVSKKVSKKAVLRNTIRRRTYSTIRKYLINLNPHTFLLVAKQGAEKIKGEALEKELEILFKKFTKSQVNS